MYLTRLKSHWRIAAVPGIFLVTAAFLSLHALWIPAKAEVAQWLLERSWQKVRAGADHAPPWPWADTQAVAVLEAPGHDVRLLVLAGDSGRNLAFGPALHGSADGRDLVISGHRDTHFDFLEDLAPGDRIVIETREARREYVAAFTDIIDTNHHDLVLDPGIDRLSLVTCYPFDAVTPNGPLRFVLTALPAPSTTSARSAALE